MLRNDEQDAALIELNGSNAAATPGRARGAQSAACPTWRRATTRGRGTHGEGKESATADDDREGMRRKISSNHGLEAKNPGFRYHSSLNLIVQYIVVVFIIV